MKTKHKKPGFSLVEIILSVAVLSILSVFILQMFATAKKLNTRAAFLDESVLLAESVFERIQANATLDAALEAGNYKVADRTETDGEIIATLYFDQNWQPIQAADVSGVEVHIVEQTIPTQEGTALYYRIEMISESETLYEMEMRQYAQQMD